MVAFEVPVDFRYAASQAPMLANSGERAQSGREIFDEYYKKLNIQAGALIHCVIWNFSNMHCFCRQSSGKAWCRKETRPGCGLWICTDGGCRRWRACGWASRRRRRWQRCYGVRRL